MKFLRQQGNYKKRLKKKWRKPKGRHSKLREKRRGLHKMPNIGYKKSEALRSKELLVSNLKGLEPLKKGDKLKISSKVGNKLRLVLLSECAKKGLIVTNVKDIKARIKKLSEVFDKQLKEKKKKEKKIIKAEPKKPEPKKKIVVKKKEGTEQSEAKKAKPALSEAKKAKPAKKVVVKK